MIVDPELNLRRAAHNLDFNRHDLCRAGGIIDGVVARLRQRQFARRQFLGGKTALGQKSAHLTQPIFLERQPIIVFLGRDRAAGLNKPLVGRIDKAHALEGQVTDEPWRLAAFEPQPRRALEQRKYPFRRADRSHRLVPEVGSVAEAPRDKKRIKDERDQSARREPAVDDDGRGHERLE